MNNKSNLIALLPGMTKYHDKNLNNMFKRIMIKALAVNTIFIYGLLKSHMLRVPYISILSAAELVLALTRGMIIIYGP